MLRASTCIQACAVACVIALAGCGGGGGDSTTPPAPRPTPPGPVTLNTSSVSLASAGDTNSFTASETNYSGGFTVSLDAASCSSNGNAVATVSPMNATGPSATFTVTAGSAAGTCKISVSDSYGQWQTISAVVTITQGVIQ